MYGGVVPLEVGLLLETLVADAADVLWRFPALVLEVALQAALVPVGSAAFQARERLRQEILASRRRVPAPRAIPCNLEEEMLRLFDLIADRLNGEPRALFGSRSSIVPAHIAFYRSQSLET